MIEFKKRNRGQAGKVCDEHFNSDVGCRYCPLNKVCCDHANEAEAHYWQLMNKTLEDNENEKQ